MLSCAAALGLLASACMHDWELFRPVDGQGAAGEGAAQGGTAAAGGLGGTAGAAVGGRGGGGGAGGTNGGGGPGGGSTGGSGGQGGEGPTVLELPIEANDRDAWEDGVDWAIATCIFGDIGWGDRAGYQWGLPVPPGATILEAHFSVFSLGRSGATGAYTVEIAVEDVADAAAFEDAYGQIIDRAYWGATVTWSIPADGLAPGDWSDSPPIDALVQHVVDRGDWQAGNHVGLAVRGTSTVGNANEQVRDYAADPALAAVLHVTYVP